MPEPTWLSGEGDPFSTPDRALEVLGLGSKSRKSKTYIKDIELANILGFIGGYYPQLTELLKTLHAKHNTTVEVVENDDGTVTEKTVPEVLSEDDLKSKYPAVAVWERKHQEQVDHFASIGGFSVLATAGMSEEFREKRVGGGKRDSSAGADRRRTGAGDLGTNSRWK